MNTLVVEPLLNICLTDMDNLCEYINSDEVKREFPFCNKSLRKIQSLSLSIAQMLYGIQGLIIMSEADKQDDRNKKIIQFQEWQKKVGGGGGQFNRLIKKKDELSLVFFQFVQLFFKFFDFLLFTFFLCSFLMLFHFFEQGAAEIGDVFEVIQNKKH